MKAREIRGLIENRTTPLNANEVALQFTTPEQGKRLLAIGVPINSADAFYYAFAVEMWENRRKHINPGTFTPNEMTMAFSKRGCGDNVPCWSFGQLYKIYDILLQECDLLPADPMAYLGSTIDDMIDNIEFTINKLKRLD